MPRNLFLALCVSILAVESLPAQQKTFLGKTAGDWALQLQNGDTKQRRNAAFALGKMGMNAALSLPSLKNAVRNEKDAKVREALVFALGEICRHGEPVTSDADLEPLFLAAATDADPYVRRSAMFGLGCLASKSNRTKTALEAGLNDGEPMVRQNAASALAQFGKDAPPLLKKALSDPDSLVKRDAASVLVYLGSDDAKVNEVVNERVHDLLPDLLPLCRDANSEVRRAALNVLVRIVTPKDTEAIPLLLAAIEDRDLENRRNAAMALSNIGGEGTAKAVPILLEAIKNGDKELRQQAALAIRNIGPKAAPAVPELIRLLRDDPDPKMREHAALALGGIGAASEPAIPTLLGKIKDTSEPRDIRVECAMALSRIGSVRGSVAVVPDLLKVLGDPKHDGRVRERVMWALRVHAENLEKMNGTRDVFTRCLKEPRDAENKMLRYDCAYMLGMVWQQQAPEETLGVLNEYLQDKTIQIFVGVSTDVTGISDEIKGGKASVKVRAKGDGRIMAADALQRMGPARYKGNAEIMRQLRTLADDPATYEPLRKKAAALIEAAK